MKFRLAYIAGTIIGSLIAISIGLALGTWAGRSPREPMPTATCNLSEEAERGRQWANTCKGCHDIDIHQPAHPFGGPNLHDVYLSVAGTQSVRYNHHYYPPLISARNSHMIWTDDNLDHYLEGPEAFLRRATGESFNSAYYMSFFIGGQDDVQVRSRNDVIAYLKAIKGHACN